MENISEIKNMYASMPELPEVPGALDPQVMLPIIRGMLHRLDVMKDEFEAKEQELMQLIENKDIHPDIQRSGLAEQYGITSTVSPDDPRAQFIGKLVRYRPALFTKDFIDKHGTMARDCTFVIRQVQKDHKGDPMLRGYAKPRDTFGRVIDPEHVEIIEEQPNKENSQS